MEPSMEVDSLPEEKKKDSNTPSEGYIFHGRWIPLGIVFFSGMILSAALRLPVLIVLTFVYYLIGGCICLYLRWSFHHRVIIEREFSGSVLRYFTGIPYDPDSLVPWWFPFAIFGFAPIYLHVILLCHLLLYSGDLTSCNLVDAYVKDGRCLVEQGTAFAFTGFCGPALYAAVGMFTITLNTKQKLNNKEQELIKRFPPLEKILTRTRSRNLPSLWDNKPLLMASIIAILIFALIPLAARPILISGVENRAAVALYWLSLPIGGLGLSLIPHIVYRLISRYNICREHLEDLEKSVQTELAPFPTMKNAIAWWSVRQYYLKDYFPLLYGLNSLGLTVSIIFTLLIALLVVLVVFLADQTVTALYRFFNIFPFFLMVIFGTLCILLLLKAATAIRQVQINHGELLKRQKQQYFMDSYDESQPRKAYIEEDKNKFYDFVDQSYDLISNFETETYPQILGIPITPTFLNIIITYLGTGLISILTKISADH